MITLGDGIQLELHQLIDTRMLVQASSGAGKSWLLRLLAEQVGSSVPTIVLDPEGEFATLRERLDMVLVGSAGEVAADVRSAAKVAQKLLELRVSAVIDLNDLKLHERRQWVKLFMEAIMAAPKRLWQPTLIMLDEAHMFAPERGSGESESTAGVIDLCSRGRKRGFGAVLATQRLSKLHKDAVAELTNICIGRTTLDIDAKRALDVLGMGNSERTTLRDLEAGEWFALGPAFTFKGVQRFQAGKVLTSHPKSGQRHKLTTPEASSKIRQVLYEFADLPEQAEAEIRDLAEAKREISQLKRQLKSKVPVVDERATERAVAAAVKQRDQHWQQQVSAVTKTLKEYGGRLSKIEQLAHVNGEAVAIESPPPVPAVPTAAPRPRPTRQVTAAPSGTHQLSRAEFRILRALYWLKDETPTKTKVGFYAGYSADSGGFNNALSKLRSAGLVAGLEITEAGVAALPDHVEEKPTGMELREWLRPKLSKAENTLLDVLLQAGGEKLSSQELAETAGYSSGSGGFNNALSRLRSLEAAVGYEREGGTKAADVFFG